MLIQGRLEFVLAPDAGAARRIRRLIAEDQARAGVVVGTWRELLDWAKRVYLVPNCSDDWSVAFKAALAEVEGAFWQESLSVAPIETAEAVHDALVQVVSATVPFQDDFASISGQLPTRSRRHVADLHRLSRALNGKLPDELAGILAVLQADGSDALQLMRVHCIKEITYLSRWQDALVEKLNRDAASMEGGESTETEIRRAWHYISADQGEAPAGSALGHLQQTLYLEEGERVVLDDTLQWLGVRDFMQEAEVAVGMVQGWLADDPTLTPAEIGVLIPDRFEYGVAVADAFGLGGIALSGAPADWWRRDLGLEVLFHLLYCRQKPAPAMALAVCLSSPLMPWTRAAGAAMAEEVMGGDYRLQPIGVKSSAGLRMLELLREGDRNPQTLAAALREFAALLNSDEAHAIHVQRAHAGIAELCSQLDGSQEIGWVALRRAVTPRFIRSEETPDYNLEGVIVWRESQEPWRKVRKLLVLGFADSSFPSGRGPGAVFSNADLEALREQANLSLDTPAAQMARLRRRFVRQLRAVSDAVTFFVPRRNSAGVRQSPSDSLVFMSRLFQGADDAQALILELDSPAGRAAASGLALAPPEPPDPPRPLAAQDLDFDRDLFTLRTDSAGNPRPESPSSLETLLVSRLAWLLRRLNAEPLGWAPEAANPMLLGSIAHMVFERLFHPNRSLPAEDEIMAAMEGHLDEVILRLAPFLRGPQWQVEMRHFREQTTVAALAWRRTLQALNAEILANEVWLQGTWSGMLVHGQADLILGLAAGRLLVVDYKRSSSAGRRPRMEKGYDCQASLYRLMLQTGGLKHAEDKALASRLRGASHTGVVYYLLNDQVSLTDTALPESGQIAGWQLIESDVSGQAMALLARRLDEVRVGQLHLNRAGDAEFFKKQAGITPYALEASPLIELFTLAGEAEELQ